MRSEVFFYAVFGLAAGLWLFGGPEVHVKQEAKVRFEHVKPVFQKRCQSCHYERRWDWTHYETAFEKRETIKDRVWSTRSMPVGGEMTESERELIRDWVEEGGAE